MLERLGNFVRRLFTTPYTPDPALRDFLARAQVQEQPLAKVTVAVLSAHESERLLGVPLARRGIQPVYLRIENRHNTPLRLYVVGIDPRYYTPLEAAGINHFSLLKRLSALGLAGWYFLPLLTLLPLKLLTAYWANRRMDDCFRSQAFPLKPIAPGSTAEGFVYTPLDSGTKAVHVSLYATGHTLTADDFPENATEMRSMSPGPTVDFTFSIAVPGLSADYLHRDFQDLCPASSLVECDAAELVRRLREMPPATTNTKGTRTGDPANLVVIGEFATILSAFAARWDESETITLATCWKTVRAFLLGSQYRYSPVSPLHLFGRSQDVALQRIRGSINERLHLRLWLTPLRFGEQPVWVGQISRDIGVRFTTKVWNLTTHRIDPDVDEARDYVVEDLLRAERVDAVGYVGGVGACTRETPRHNLTGDPFYTDGKRAVIVLSQARAAPRFVAWG